MRAPVRQTNLVATAAAVQANLASRPMPGRGERTPKDLPEDQRLELWNLFKAVRRVFKFCVLGEFERWRMHLMVFLREV